MQALAFEKFGGPDVLEYLELPTPAIPAGAVQVRMGAAGLNFADIYRRKGNYVLHGNPLILVVTKGSAPSLPWVRAFRGGNSESGSVSLTYLFVMPLASMCRWSTRCVCRRR